MNDQVACRRQGKMYICHKAKEQSMSDDDDDDDSYLRPAGRQ
jgi:hypothetical protein